MKNIKLKSLIKEEPDVAFLPNGIKLQFNDADATTFIIHDNDSGVISQGIYHSDLVSMIRFHHEKIISSSDNIITAGSYKLIFLNKNKIANYVKAQGKPYMDARYDSSLLSGRLWTDANVISFWRFFETDSKYFKHSFETLKKLAKFGGINDITQCYFHDEAGVTYSYEQFMKYVLNKKVTTDGDGEGGDDKVKSIINKIRDLNSKLNHDSDPVEKAKIKNKIQQLRKQIPEKELRSIDIDTKYDVRRRADLHRDSEIERQSGVNSLAQLRGLKPVSEKKEKYTITPAQIRKLYKGPYSVDDIVFAYKVPKDYVEKALRTGSNKDKGINELSLKNIMKIILNESPDTVVVDDERYFYRNTDSLSFILVRDGKSGAISGTPERSGHGTLKNTIKLQHIFLKEKLSKRHVKQKFDRTYKSADNYIFWNEERVVDALRNGEHTIDGRVFLEPKVISFWDNFNVVGNLVKKSALFNMLESVGVDYKNYKYEFEFDPFISYEQLMTINTMDDIETSVDDETRKKRQREFELQKIAHLKGIKTNKLGAGSVTKGEKTGLDSTAKYDYYNRTSDE